jgi:hypothetical protein
MKEIKNESKINSYVQAGLVISVILSIILAYAVPTVIGLWYNIGSLCIPGIIFSVIGAYYNKFAVSEKYAIAEMIAGVVLSASWLILRDAYFKDSYLSIIEPMLIGLAGTLIIRVIGIISSHKRAVI